MNKMPEVVAERLVSEFNRLGRVRRDIDEALQHCQWDIETARDQIARYTEEIPLVEERMREIKNFIAACEPSVADALLLPTVTEEEVD